LQLQEEREAAVRVKNSFSDQRAPVVSQLTE